jgi:GAF domain-containing protein
MDAAVLLDHAELAALAAAFHAAGADEGTVWLLDPDGHSLSAVRNTGPDAGLIEGFRQPVGSGLISMVLETEQLFCENEVQKNAAQDKRLDRRLGKITAAMIAVPLHLLGECRGVVSCVILQGPEAGRGFTGRDLDLVADAVTQLQVSMERAILQFES